MLTIRQLATKINSDTQSNHFTNLVNHLFLIDEDEINLEKFNNLSSYYKDIVYIDDNIEIIIIYWPPRSSTPIHNHPENGCIMRVLHGSLREDIYDSNILIETNYIYGGATKRHNQYHKITNELDHQCVSIHVYSPPNYYKNR